MAEPDKPPCPLCGGAEVIYISDSDVETCRCLKARLFRQHLGPEIALAPTILRSPLLAVDNDEVTTDCTRTNMFITTQWVDLLPHLKWVFYCKGMRFRFRVVTDEKIRTVYVGNESYTQRSKSKRDDLQTFNSLGDLVGPDYDLVLIRLGKLGHKNIAAPGAFKEALMLREVSCLPTWIIEETRIGDCFVYSEDVVEYIDRRFERLSIKRGARVQRQHSQEVVEDVSGDEDPSEMGPLRAEIQEETSKEVQEEPVMRVARPLTRTVSTASDVEMPGEGRRPQKSGGSGWKKKRSGNDEGPL